MSAAGGGGTGALAAMGMTCSPRGTASLLLLLLLLFDFDDDIFVDSRGSCVSRSRSCDRSGSVLHSLALLVLGGTLPHMRVTRRCAHIASHQNRPGRAKVLKVLGVGQAAMQAANRPTPRDEPRRYTQVDTHRPRDVDSSLAFRPWSQYRRCKGFLVLSYTVAVRARF